jgi:uncharacterized protein with FMN-binding domain
MHANGAPGILDAGSSLSGPVSATPLARGQHSSSSSSSTTNSSPAPGAAISAVGASEQYGYGVLAVKLTEYAGRITDISLSSLTTAEQYSENLAQQVIPVLRREVLSAQSAHITAVSGATYTSEAYAYSVQSALDSLKVK